MEEAEALSTKLAIQVEGNLKCLGSAQHIKNRYGGGYELEIKLEYPTKEEIKAVMPLYGVSAKTVIKSNSEIKALLDKAEAKELFDEIKESGSGETIYRDLKKGGVDATVVTEWVLTEKNWNETYRGITEKIHRFEYH